LALAEQYLHTFPLRLCEKQGNLWAVSRKGAKAQSSRSKSQNAGGFFRRPIKTENEIAKHIVDAALKIHKRFGPGLLESVYEAVLAAELERRGFRVKRQQPIPVIYEDIRLEIGFRADLIVEDKVIVEIKSVEAIAPVHYKQVLTYLKVADKRLGLLINFNVELIKDGIKRVVNGIEGE
jgi:GxxExxY protein